MTRLVCVIISYVHSNIYHMSHSIFLIRCDWFFQDLILSCQLFEMTFASSIQKYNCLTILLKSEKPMKDTVYLKKKSLLRCLLNTCCLSLDLHFANGCNTRALLSLRLCLLTIACKGCPFLEKFQPSEFTEFFHLSDTIFLFKLQDRKE